jgi:hypothetical protein
LKISHCEAVRAKLGPNQFQTFFFANRNEPKAICVISISETNQQDETRCAISPRHSESYQMGKEAKPIQDASAHSYGLKMAPFCRHFFIGLSSSLSS